MPLSTVLVLHPDPPTVQRIQAALVGRADKILHSAVATRARELGVGQDVALVVVAASLRGASGYALAGEFKEMWPAASVVLTTSGFEVFDKGRAKDVGVAGHIRQGFQADAFLALVESLVGPLPLKDAPAAESSDDLGAPLSLVPSALEPIPSLSASTSRGRSGAVPAPRPPVSEERLATFLPRDYRQVPLVRVDPDVVGPAVERAILEVLPEVVEAVLRTALGSSAAFRDLVGASVDEAVREALPEIATRVVRERLTQLEAHADTPS
jgi:hypothetical protein